MTEEGCCSPDDTIPTEDDDEDYGHWMHGMQSQCYGSPEGPGSPGDIYWPGEGAGGNVTPAGHPSINAPRNSVCRQESFISIGSVTSTGPSRKNTAKLLENPQLFARTLSEKLAGPWIEHAFQKRECITFIPLKDNPDRCGCGRVMSAHSASALSPSYHSPSSSSDDNAIWSIAHHTHASCTDAFGTIVFQGGAHPHKAPFVRLAFDSDPHDIIYLLEKVWNLPPPRLVVTVHGGMSNFELQEKLGRQFREGLLKAAQTTGAWIITHGVDSGVVRQVAQAIDEAGISARMRSRVVIIGIAPWGVLKRRERLVGKDHFVQYDQNTFHSKNAFSVLNDRHSYFLLVDNGTVGRHGADLKLRRTLEAHIAELTLAHGNRKMPIVCAVLEGGTSTISAVHQYLTTYPPVPVIICDGSGRASDLISFAKRRCQDDGGFSDEVRSQLISLISSLFPVSGFTPEQILNMIIECARQKDLLTVFRYGEEKTADVDHAILSAILNKQNLSLPDQLCLTLAWNRVDVARACLFAAGRSWPTHTLHGAMMDALRLNRVEFVECLLENGVSMKNFLTVSRLEQLYNLDQDSVHSVRTLDPEDTHDKARYLSLVEIGLIFEKLMGNAYKSTYTSRKFRSKYDRYSSILHSRMHSIQKKFARKAKKSKCMDDSVISEMEECQFPHPFNDLLCWAILTRRPEMARSMWAHGEDSLAKSLTAIRLYKSIARVAEEEYLELEVAGKLREHAEEFREESLLLLDHCYRTDAELTLQLLTAEMEQWGHHTVLSLAVLANNKSFLAHQCCQLLLAELWHGNLRLRSRSSLRVMAGLIFPPAALTLAYRDTKNPQGSDGKRQSIHEDAEHWPEDFSPYNDRDPRGLSHTITNVFKRSFTAAKSSVYGGKYSTDEHDALAGGNWVPTKKVTFVRPVSRKASVYQSCESFKKTDADISWLQKFRFFYAAPITKFWAWALSFHFFLITFSYTLLIETPLKPTYIECGLAVYMLGFAMEHFRKLIVLSSLTWRERCRVFFGRYWNVFTAIAIITFFIGFAFRLNPPMRETYGRVILCLSNVLWHMKVLEYLSVHPLLGPYINMAAKMVVAMSYIIVLLLVTLMAFGVSRQAITFPRKQWDWILVRNIFFKPYFMLYGEVYAGEIDTCGDEGYNCIPGWWIPPVLMVIFLLVANILLINMLIAIFNSIYNAAIIQSREVWLFERYQQVLEYNDTPLLPPPFTILSLSGRAFLHCIHCFSKTPQKSSPRRMGMLDFSMKLNLDEEQLAVIHDFEEDCMDELTRVKRARQKRDEETTLKNTAQQAELVSQKVQDMLSENAFLKNRLIEMEYALERLESGQRFIADKMAKAQTTEQAQKKHHSHLCSQLSESTQSLPGNADDVKPRRIRDRRAEYTTITDNILLSPQRRLRMPLLILHEDQTLRKYASPLLHSELVSSSAGGRRRRLCSSSVSITADLQEMERSVRSTSTEEE